MTQGASHSIKLNEWQSLSELTLICTTASHVVSSQFIGTNHEINMWLQISRFHELWPYCIVPFWMHMFGSAFPLLQVYRKWRVIQRGDQSIWEQQSESNSREQPTARHILQTAYQVGMPDTAVHSAGSKSNYTVSTFYLTTSVCYILPAECTTLLQYVWAVCQVRYTNTLCVGSLPIALH
jgi:hypothetical protein